MSTAAPDTEPDVAHTATGGSQTDVVLQGVKRMITSGQLGPGSRLPIEKDLAVSLGVSRGSLREGVRALCIMGVLETRQGDGTYVTSLDSKLLLAPMGFMVDLQTPEHRHDLHGVRRVLESEAASRAALYISDEQLAKAAETLAAVEPLVLAEKITDHEAIMEADVAFHRIVAEAADNAALAALIDALANRTMRARIWLGLHRQGQVLTAHREHLAILHALEARQPDRARLLMGHHLLVVEDSIQDQPVIDEDQ
ncbi:FadR/GntR family transcriptional regulator [Lacisediminihabitans sp.]|jgi:DNA-binding FadR family transcriptional regulator|uniref:FadR/GntR family transcriptional regulator n=1 Tax=Lacisediminihabitans sp. TaxID=2787631 RepID=UPI000ED0E362|nr:FadR family transcriptional regulator [Microbacteriaceae bacterium]